MAKVEIVRVESKSQWSAFIGLPWAIYGNDPHWVPPLRIAVRDLLNIEKNPFFKHAFLYPLLAYRDGKPVGRVAGIIDDNHNSLHEEKTAFFGFFESIDDADVARALLAEGARWARGRGMETLRGPMNPSTNHECGLLVEGFQDEPYVMMTYNPPYYARLIEAAGLAKAKDLLSYELNRKNANFSERLIAHAERLRNKSNIRIRPLDPSRFDQQIDELFQVYNDSWVKNWGFVPLNHDEFVAQVKELKMIYDPRLVFFVDVRDEVAGFGFALPDVNQVLKRVRDGRLFPTGLLKILWGLKGPGRRKLKRMRIPALGVKRKFIELGVGPIIYTEFLKRGPELGYDACECSWILEDNIPMNRALTRMGAERTKVYRLYEAPVSRLS